MRVVLVKQNDFGIRTAKTPLWLRALFEELILFLYLNASNRTDAKFLRKENSKKNIRPNTRRGMLASQFE